MVIRALPLGAIVSPGGCPGGWGGPWGPLPGLGAPLARECFPNVCEIPETIRASIVFPRFDAHEVPPHGGITTSLAPRVAGEGGVRPNRMACGTKQSIPQRLWALEREQFQENIYEYNMKYAILQNYPSQDLLQLRSGFELR